MIPVPQQDGLSQWAIRVDSELFTQSKLPELNNKKPLIIGVTSWELPADVATIPNAKAIWNETLESAFAGHNTTENKVLKQIAQYVYIDSKGYRNDNMLLAQQIGKINTDTYFHNGAAQEATSKAFSGRPVWVYNFDFYSDNVFKPDYPFEKGAPHTHDMCYLHLLDPRNATNYFSCPLKYAGDYRTVANYMGEMWTNFAKNGNPSPNGIAWPQFHNVSNANTMTIRSKLSIEKHFYIETANFWNYLKPNIEHDLNGVV